MCDATMLYILVFLFFYYASCEDSTGCTTVREADQTPTTYRTVQQSHALTPSEKLEIIPPTFRTETLKLLITESHCPGEELFSETKPVISRPAYNDVQVLPAVYETIYVKKQTSPPKEGWILLSEEHITYEKISGGFKVTEIRRLKLPERAIEVSIPETIENIRVRKVHKPSALCAKSERIPAQFRTMVVQRLIKLGGVSRISVPAKIKTFTTKSVDRPSNIVATPIACDTSGALPLLAKKLPEHPGPNVDYFYLREPGTGENGWIGLQTAEIVALTPEFEKRLPSLPWPPPRGSWLFPIPRIPFESAKVLADVGSVLAPALRNSGYVNQRYYRIDNPYAEYPGFAIVTQLEKWVDNGAPDKRNRFVTAGKEKFSLTDYIRNLFFAAEGTYRLIVILITDQT